MINTFVVWQKADLRQTFYLPTQSGPEYINFSTYTFHMRMLSKMLENGTAELENEL